MLNEVEVKAALHQTQATIISEKNYFASNFHFLNLDTPPVDLLVISIAEDIYRQSIINFNANAHKTPLSLIMSLRQHLASFVANSASIERGEMPYFVAVATAFIDIMARQFGIDYGMSGASFIMHIDESSNY